MSRNIFGWSYPPGCSGPPDDERPCETCGRVVDNCECPECPNCGEVGNPYCYEQKHLHYNKTQLIGQAKVRIEEHRTAMADEELYIQWLTQQLDNYTQ